MKRIENECVSCGMPCVEYCRFKNAVHYYCDECGEEKQLYDFDGEELCINCIEERLDKVG